MRGATFTYVATYVTREGGILVTVVSNRIHADTEDEAIMVAEANVPPGHVLVAVRPAGPADRQPFLL